MSKANSAETALLALIYCATPWANVADNAASSPATHIDYSLHTADPGEAGTAATSEVTYTSYTRAVKTRDTNATTGHTAASGSVSPNTSVTFPAGTGGSGTVSYFATSLALNSTPTSSTNAILHSGAVSPTIATGAGITPVLTATITED